MVTKRRRTIKTRDDADATPRFRVIRSFNAKIGDEDVFITRANVARVEEIDDSKRQEFIASGALEEVNPTPAPE
jgi:hypothetical protein